MRACRTKPLQPLPKPIVAPLCAAMEIMNRFRSCAASRRSWSSYSTRPHSWTRVLTHFRVGNAGVDIFFVISGFVMWSSTARRPATPAAFLRQRLIRLVPLYWFFTLALLGAWAAMKTGTSHILPPSGSDVLLSLAFIPVFNSSGQLLPYLAQGWTLNFEMFFYVMFAGALAMPRERRFLPVACVLVGLPLLGLMVATPQQIRVIPALVLLSPLLVEFLLGVILASTFERAWRPRLAWCWASVAAGVAALVVLPSPPGGDDWTRLAFYGAPAFLIVGGAVGVETSASRFRAGRLPLLLGAASYSIYLSHTFAISMAGKLLPKSLGIWVFSAAAVLASIVVGVAVYQLMERPLLKALRTPGAFSAITDAILGGIVPELLPPAPLHRHGDCRVRPGLRRLPIGRRRPNRVGVAATLSGWPARLTTMETWAFPFPGTGAACGAKKSPRGP